MLKLLLACCTCRHLWKQVVHMASVADPWSKLAKYLPTGAILAFTSLSPLTTSNGHCGPSEWAVTGAFLLLMTACTFLMSFTETIVEGKKHYYGLVTPYGLWSPMYNSDHITPEDPAAMTRLACGVRILRKEKYKATAQDFVHACISTSVFLSLALLTDPVAVCFFGTGLPPVVKQAVPPIVAGAASVMFSFFGPPRPAVGFPGGCPDDSAEAASRTEVPAKLP